MSLKLIVSGGQTGVDRGALDAAIAADFEHSGYCPRGRLSEDGPLDPKYQLIETTTRDYAERTRANAILSDGTLIMVNNDHPLSGGTKLTQNLCRELNQPLFIVRATGTDPGDWIDRVAAFVDGFEIRRLNVAGPRLSKWVAGYQYSYDLVLLLIQRRNDAQVREHGEGWEAYDRAS